MRKELRDRLIVAAWGIPLLILLIFLGSWVFALAIAIVSVMAQSEFYRMGNIRGNIVRVGLVMGAFLPIIAHYSPTGYPLTILIPGFLIILLFLPWQSMKKVQEKLGITISGVIYPSLMLSTLIPIRDGSYGFKFGGAWIILFFLSSIWICDTAAYFGGTQFGKNKLAPLVSPNKTWEGAVFGILGAVLWAIIAAQVLNPLLNLYECVGIALIVGVVGQIGDLSESIIKRGAGIKDAGLMFGPHGGMLDRFDSIIATAPAFWIYLHLLGKL